MKDLLSKENYSSKIHASLMKCSGYPPFYRHPLYGLPGPKFYKNICIPSSMIFQKCQPFFMWMVTGTFSEIFTK